MLTFKVGQRFIVLLILVSMILTGCGLFGGSDAPAAEQAQLVDKNTAAEGQPEPEAEEAGDISAPVDESTYAEEPASVEVARNAAAPAEEYEESTEEKTIAGEMAKEEAAPVLADDRVDMITEAESGYAMGSEGADSVAATAMPLPTASPSIADLDTTMSSSADEESSEETMALADVEGETESVAPEPIRQQVEPLKAGEVDDNAQWDDYLLYRRNYRGPQVHQRDITERYVVEVVDGQGRPILGATVRFSLPGQQSEEIYTTHTYATGQAMFHPQALDTDLAQVDRFLVDVEKDDVIQQFSLTRFEAQATTSFTDRWTVTLAWQPQGQNSLNLDVLFLIDATGSMADEINKVQSTIFDVSAQIDALPENPNVRYGMVTYRDRGDSYITRSYEFTPDVRDFAQNLNTVFADGGGDYPESLNEAMHKALYTVEWRGENTVQLVFLIADAPPHLDYAQDYDYAVEMENAAQRGIKIFPIASSGLDDQGEYIFRQIAQYTQGRFIFLTYDGPTNGGAPGDVTTHHVDEDDYSVENLDDLIVRLVEEELAYQNPQLAQTQ